MRRYLEKWPVVATSGPFEARFNDEYFIIVTHADESPDKEHWIAVEELPALIKLLQDAKEAAVALPGEPR